MSFLLELAGIVFEIDSKYGGMEYFCREFIVDNKRPVCKISLTDNDLEYEWRISPGYDNTTDSFRRNSLIPVLERNAVLRKITELFPFYSILFMHGAVVSDGLYAYMFTAESGVGKSTRAQIFVDNWPNSFILNGDKPLLRVESDHIMVYSSPWKGKEGKGVNTKVPLKAICLLERSDETVIKKMTIEQSFDFLIKQTCFPTSHSGIIKTMQLLKSIENKTQILGFQSSPTYESVKAVWKVANS